MKTIIILAMHGSPPNDFPKSTLMEYFGLHARLEHMPVADPEHGREGMAGRYQELDTKLRTWPPHEPERPVPHCIHKAGETLAEGYG